MAWWVDMTVYRSLINKILFFFICAITFSGCQNNRKETDTMEKEPLPFYNSSEFDAEWIEEADAQYKKIHQIDTFSLKNQLGHTITKDSLKGHIYVANFFFSICPSICPKMVVNLHTLQEEFKDNSQIKLVSFSVMPWVDSVARLQQYGKENQINPQKWYLLTGNKEVIYNLGRKSYFAEKGLGLQKKTNEFMHTETMLLIDKQARIRGIYNATQKLDMERVIDDIAVLIKE